MSPWTCLCWKHLLHGPCHSRHQELLRNRDHGILGLLFLGTACTYDGASEMSSCRISLYPCFPQNHPPASPYYHPLQVTLSGFQPLNRIKNKNKPAMSDGLHSRPPHALTQVPLSKGNRFLLYSYSPFGAGKKKNHEVSFLRMFNLKCSVP